MTADVREEIIGCRSLFEQSKIANSVDKYQEICKLHQSSNKVCEKNKFEISKRIEDSQSCVASLRESLNNHPKQTIEDRIRRLEEEKCAIERENALIENQISEQQKKIDSLSHDQSEFRKDERKTTRLSQRMIPTKVNTIGLYRNVTKIRWDFNAEKRSKGWFIFDGTKQVEKFEYDFSEGSQSKAVKSVWEVLWRESIGGTSDVKVPEKNVFGNIMKVGHVDQQSKENRSSNSDETQKMDVD
eukprot:230370_1